MPVQRKVNPQQMDIILNFVEKNREVANGRHPIGPYGNSRVKQAWKYLTAQLNTVSNGPTKTPDQWRRYWIEFKAKTRSKAADSRRSTLNEEKGGRLAPLTQHEQRALILIGQTMPTSKNQITEEGSKAENGNEEESEFLMSESLMSGNIEGTEEEIKNENVMDEVSDDGSMSETSPYPDPLRIENVRIQRERKHRRKHYRPIRQEDKMPAWVMRLEERRIAAEERLTTAVEALTATLDGRLADLSNVFEKTMRDIASRLPR